MDFYPTSRIGQIKEITMLVSDYMYMYHLYNKVPLFFDLTHCPENDSLFFGKLKTPQFLSEII